MFLTDAEGPADGAQLLLEGPAWMLLEGRSRVSLRVEMEASAASADNPQLLTAELHAPGLQTAPAGEQAAPAKGPVGFAWTVRAEAPGVLEWRPEVSLRSAGEISPARTTRLLWSKGVPVWIVAPAGLGARSLGPATLASAGLALVAAVGSRMMR